jgi:hypothetical protein
MERKGTEIWRGSGKLDVIIKSKRDKTCLLIDTVLLSDMKVIKTEAGKNKTQNLSTEIHILWHIPHAVHWSPYCPENY